MRIGLALRLVALTAAVVGVVVLPHFLSDFRASQFAFVGLYFIAILGLDILTGSNGQISLGHGAFMAVGAYTTAILMAKHGVRDIATIPLAALVAGAVGLVFGIPALRLSGLYLALATFGIAISLPSILKKFDGFTGGSTGLNLFGLKQQTGGGVGVHVLGHTFTENDWLYYLTWSIGGVLFVLAWALLSGRLGRSLRALRDSETAAASSGINLATHKIAAFGISAAYAGVAGSLLAINIAYVNPDTYPIVLSLYLLVGVAVGGLGSLWGAVLGALLIEFLQLYAGSVVSFVPLVHATSKTPGVPSVVFGAVLVILMLVLPTGVGGLVRRLARVRS